MFSSMESCGSDGTGDVFVEYPQKNEAISQLKKKENHLQIYLGWGYVSSQKGTLSPIIMVQRQNGYI